MTPQDIADEFGKWANIFLDHMTQTEKLYQEYKEHMVTMDLFMEPIIKDAIKNSRSDIPIDLLRDTLAKLGQLRKDLAKYSGKNAHEGRLRKMIVDLGRLLTGLKNKYEKM